MQVPQLRHPESPHEPARHFALVTGASSGIGLELAREFASHDFDLIIAAENVGIFAAARELEESGASIEAVQVDLSTPAGVDELHGRIELSGRPLTAAAFNAGIAEFGAFATDTRLATELKMIDLNVRSTVHLAKRVVADMVRRGEGKVLFTSSTSATYLGAYQAVYAATKAFGLSFALALREELKDTGITVTTLMPGPTDTLLFERTGAPSDHLQKDTPAAVARSGFEGLMNGDERVVTEPPSSRLRSRILRACLTKLRRRFATFAVGPRKR
jgi:uncharacterized protein